MMKKLYTFLVLVLFLPLSTMAQMHYPIRTNTIVTPPVPFSLDGFVSQPGKLMLNVLVDDVTLSQYPVKLQLHIEGNGIRISSNPNIPQQPIYLDGGVTTQLTGSDLEFYFNPENLLFQGYSLNEYRRNGRLPEGVYRIRFEVLDFYRDFKVSSAIPAVAMMSLTNGPVLTFPANRSEIDVDANPVLRFSWMAVFTAIPDALIEYRFKLWQIRPDNRDPFEITKVTTPVYEVDLSETALLYDGFLPPLEKGARYVWQVTALDLSGNVLFKKDGNSDIATFRYGYECAAPSAVISKVSHNSVSVSWNSNSSIREYVVSYRKENDSEWQEVTTSNVGLTIDNLEHSVQYELYVRASCGDASSNNERLLRFKTDRFVDYSCGAGASRISFENQDPLPALHRFDEFKAADFYIEVTEVSGTQGVFSGRGLASIPFLEFLKFEVSFNDITINTDRQMIDGHVVFLHEEETGKIPGRNMGVGGSQGAEGSQELCFEEALNEIADQKVTIDEEVADVSVSNGNVTVVTESGQTQSYLVGENQTLAIVTPESIVVVDQASGQVFQAPNTPPGSSSNVRTPSQSGIHGCLVTFRPSATQRLGFDAVGNGVVKPNSYFLRDRNGDAVPWKSLEAGNTDYVAMLTNGDCQADSLRFIRESGLLTPTTPGRNNSLELLLTGGFQGQEERLTVARATTNHINDSTSEEILTEAGVLGLVSYQRITRDVFLIPVNGASFPTASTQLSDIEKRLNEIYGSAVINWNVHFDEPIEVGRINEAEFKVEGTAMLSKYTSDMNRVIRTYKRNRPSDDNSLYLFFVELSDLGTSRKGFMPLAGNFGFIFNFSASDFDLLAHELAHGAFNLRHTFSDKAQHYFPVQQTANLMDYAGGTDLWKYQWDLIHNPESILFAWGQDEEEGEFKGNTPIEKVVNTIEMLRCGFVSNRKVKFEKNVFFSWLKESVTVRDFDGLYDGNTYKYIHIQLLNDSKLIEYPADLQLAESDSYFNSLLKLARGEVLKLDFGGLIILVDKDNAQNLLEYLTPTEHQYKLQQRQFVQSIADLFDKQFYTREKVINILKVSPQCLYESLTQDQRLSLLSLINNNSNIPETVENIVIDIIRTTPDEQIEYLFDNLHTTGLLAYFDRVMNNVGGSNNYTRFIYELLKLYLKQFSDNLNCFEATPWGQLYVDNQVRSVGSFNYIYETPYYWWRKGCKVPTWRYGTRGVFISDHNTCGYFNKENVEIDPFEPVVIYFEEDLSFYELPPELESRIVSMPAFVLPWLRNEASNKEAMRMAGNAVTIVESFTPLGATGKVASGLRGVLIKAFVYINKVDATVKILLTNEAIKESISRIRSEERRVGKECRSGR